MFPSSATLWGEGSVWGRFKPQPGEPWLREQAGELKQQFGLPLRTSEIWQTKKSKKNAANICVDAFKVRVPKRHMFILDTPFTWKSTTINKKCISFWMMTNPFKKMVKLTKTNLLKKRWSRTWKYRISWTCVLVPIPIFHSWRNSSRRFLHANARRGTKYFEARAALRPSQWYQLLPRFCHKKKGTKPQPSTTRRVKNFPTKHKKKTSWQTSGFPPLWTHGWICLLGNVRRLGPQTKMHPAETDSSSRCILGYATIPARPKRCQYDPKGWLMGTLYHSFSTP